MEGPQLMPTGSRLAQVAPLPFGGWPFFCFQVLGLYKTQKYFGDCSVQELGAGGDF